MKTITTFRSIFITFSVVFLLTFPTHINGNINLTAGILHQIALNGKDQMKTGSKPNPPIEDLLVLGISPNQTVHYGYPAKACALISVSVSGGTPPYTYSWSNGENTASFEVCPEASTYYFVTVTDADGNAAQAHTRVCVIDVRCGNNGNKIEICHYPPGNPGNAHTLCVGLPAVAAHLAHGDSLGDCNIDHVCPDTNSFTGENSAFEISRNNYLNISPNPAINTTQIVFRLNKPGMIMVRMSDLLGITVQKVFKGYVNAFKDYIVNVDITNDPPGIYLLVLTQDNAAIMTKKLIIPQ